MGEPQACAPSQNAIRSSFGTASIQVWISLCNPLSARRLGIQSAKFITARRVRLPLMAKIEKLESFEHHRRILPLLIRSW